MHNIEVIILLMTIFTAMYSVAAKINISYPILLVITGLVIGLVPWLPNIELSPDIAFLIFLPPLLYWAACSTSWHDFRKFIKTISMLAIGLVLLTTFGIAVFAHYYIPGFGWPAAFLLGAIISPSDAIAASSALKGIGLPRRILTILEGESLVNDASALIAYRYAVMALTTGNFVWWESSIQFGVMGVGGIVCGIALGYLLTLVHKYMFDNATAEVTVTVLAPFIAYLLAEYIHVSGVLAVVSLGLFVSWRSYEIYSFQMRMKMNNFWDVMVFLLNGLVFILMGLQLPTIIAQSSPYTFMSLVEYGLSVSVIAILIRIIWVFPISHLFSWPQKASRRRAIKKRNARMVIAWAGMRGVVSLASALALPHVLSDGSEFEQRGPILFITFTVILVTLVFQGLTLPILAKRLKVKENKHKSINEEKALRLLAVTSSVEFIETDLAFKVHKRIYSELKEKFARKVNHLRSLERKNDGEDTRSSLPHHELLKEYLNAELAVSQHQREVIIQLHKEGTYSEQSLRKIEQELDIWNLSLSEKLRAAEHFSNPKEGL